MRSGNGLCAAAMGLLMLTPLLGQEETAGQEERAYGFSLEIELGARTFNEDEGGKTTYQSLGLYPEFSYGKIGVGLGLLFNYRFVNDEGESGFELREEDWIPDNDRSLLDLYLPIFRYLRYGRKGDPLYAKAGSIEEGTLGNGFLMGGYQNTILLPERRYAGLAFDVDGRLFGFPYLGVETFAGNVARFDVVGGRAYGRPLAGSGLGLLSELQVGTTIAADTEPDAVYDFTEKPESVSTYDPGAVKMYGFDLFQPVAAGESFTGALYADAAFQPGGDSTSSGGLIGFGGEAAGFVNYSVNTLLIGGNFVPFYFDATYDLYRQQKYEIYSGRRDVAGYAGWLAGLGFGFFDDTVVFNTSVNAAFIPQADEDSTYPRLRSTFSLGQGVLPGIYFDVTYDKRSIRELSDLGEAEDSYIETNVHYRAGPAVISLGYTLRYVPSEGDWDTTARLSTTVEM